MGTNVNSAPLRLTQLEMRPGRWELGPGQLAADLLPVGEIARSAEEALAAYGPDMLGYGANAGAGPLRRWLARRLTRRGVHCGPDRVLITGGTTQALAELATEFAVQRRMVLTERLTYDLAVNVFAQHGVPVGAVPGPVDLDPDAVRRAALRARARTGHAPVLYLIPTFHNPTGRVLSLSRRAELVALARAEGLLIVEDDAYAELWYQRPPPPSLADLAGGDGTVIGLGTVSKCVAPGLRVGWLTADAARVERMAAGAVRRSAGGPNHFAAAVVARLVLSGRFDTLLPAIRGALRARCDALVGALGDELTVSAPAGGYFVWVRLPAGVDEHALVAEADARGVSIAPGSRFGDCAGEPAVRLCVSVHAPAELAAAAAALAAATEAVDR